MMLKSVGLLELPVELICHVLGYLELHDLLHCSRVSCYALSTQLIV